MKNTIVCKKIIFICLISVILILLIINCCSWPVLYSNNQSLDNQTNKQIKKLILISIKDLFYPIQCTDKSSIYSKTTSNKIIQYDNDSGIKKSFVFIIDKDFMNKIHKIDEYTYAGIVKTYFPNEYSCHIEITNTDNDYKISYFQLDI